MANGIYTFQTVVVPGADGGTWLGGINNAGQVAGYFVSSPSPYPQAFIDTNGVFAPITGEGLSAVAPGGINNNGQVSGAHGTSKVAINGFLWSPDGSWQNISSDPSAPSQGIDKAYGVNDAGQVVGADFPFGDKAFLWQNGSFSFFQVPAAAATEARGINNAGEIVGIYSTGGPEQGFADINGQFSTISVPGAVATDPAAVNLAGVIAGSYFDGQHWHGFVDTAGQMTFVDVPGAPNTWITGINDSGQLSGYDTPVGRPIEGFIATDPPADPVTTMVRQDYQAAFGRDADTGAQSFWTNEMKTAGVTPRDFVWALTTSAEGQSLHGQQSNGQYVDSLYVNALGRHADLTAQAAWSAVLQSGATRYDVLWAIAGSTEGQRHFAATHG